jgi:hypothetical protein
MMITIDSSDDRSMIHHHVWCHRLRTSPDSPHFRVINFTSLFSINYEVGVVVLEIIIILFYFFRFFWNNIYIPIVKGKVDVRMHATEIFNLYYTFSNSASDFCWITNGIYIYIYID